ncbi:MAG: IS4 family transposase [Anaerolineae bacterium]
MPEPTPHINNRHKAAHDNPDHIRRRQTPAPTDAEIEQRLNELVKPAVFAEIGHYHALGLRNRILTLPVMVAAMLALLWRHLPGVCELQRLLARERILWAEPTQVSQPALSERLLTFPAELFERILITVLATLPARRVGQTLPVPAGLAGVPPRFSACYALDGSTLDALFRKLHALQENPAAPLAGHLVVLCDLFTHLPAKIWFAEDSQANDKAFLPEVLQWLPENSLLVFDLGYFAFTFFDALWAQGISFATRCRAKTSFTIEKILLQQPGVRDQLVHLGKYRSNPSQHPVRLIEVYVTNQWRQYLTNVLDPQQLSVVEVVALYEQRWQIEMAFLQVKRLLGLAYIWVGSLNGVQLQVWATWLYYAMLIDLCVDVAAVLQLPVNRISVEMVSRSLYYYAQAQQHGDAGTAATYFAEPRNRDLGVVKRLRPGRDPTLVAQVQALLATPAPPLP